MTDFRRYTDEDVPFETGGLYGCYEASLSADEVGVEVHFFRKDTELSAYVTKSPRVTVATAQRVAWLIIEQYCARPKCRLHIRPQLDYR